VQNHIILFVATSKFQYMPVALVSRDCLAHGCSCLRKHWTILSSYTRKPCAVAQGTTARCATRTHNSLRSKGLTNNRCWELGNECSGNECPGNESSWVRRIRVPAVGPITQF